MISSISLLILQVLSRWACFLLGGEENQNVFLLELLVIFEIVVYQMLQRLTLECVD
jgi:hypothetical protein